jgi:hypothetical protein
MRNEPQSPTWEPFTEKYYEAVRGLRERWRSQVRFEKDHPFHVGTNFIGGDLYIVYTSRSPTLANPETLLGTFASEQYYQTPCKWTSAHPVQEKSFYSVLR